MVPYVNTYVVLSMRVIATISFKTLSCVFSGPVFPISVNFYEDMPNIQLKHMFKDILHPKNLTS